ncbi:hypothetical protein Cgig2_021617 [Carnegiea gigantea]|uniref:Uncharacterized protein n=1 Tax=Carnegiea gigantea TaxID=171969 RepID=A0A9Q1GRE9_9CARY|nr:hypothetical protein Cgig2_021617 [Carnegiea gigantea]
MDEGSGPFAPLRISELEAVNLSKPQNFRGNTELSLGIIICNQEANPTSKASPPSGKSLPSGKSPPSALPSPSAQCREREREREGGSRSHTDHRGLGFKCGFPEPPISPSPAAGCSLLGISRASDEFLRSCLRGDWAGRRFLSPPAPSAPAYQSPATFPAIGVSLNFRRRTVFDGLFRGQPGGGVGLTVRNPVSHFHLGLVSCSLLLIRFWFSR